MQVIHITPSSNGYELVEMVANRMSRNNHLAVIKTSGGFLNFTGGLIFRDTPALRAIFNNVPNADQYALAMDMKTTPWVKGYYEDNVRPDVDNIWKIKGIDDGEPVVEKKNWLERNYKFIIGLMGGYFLLQEKRKKKKVKKKTKKCCS